MNPTISVILNVYNGEKYIDQCVESVLAQTFRDFELLIIDDGSTDGTAARVERLSPLRFERDERGIYDFPRLR